MTLARVMLAILIAASQTTSPQQKTEPHLSLRGEPQFLARILTSELDINGASIQTCIIVYPDRFFRMEKATRKVADSHTRRVWVAGDKLTDPEFAELQKLLGDPEVAKLDASASKKAFPFKDKLQVVYASIPRGNGRIQHVAVPGTETVPLDPAAESLANFLRTIESRDVPVYRDVTPNNCHEPSGALPVPPSK